VAFAIPYVLAYLALFGFYAPIAAGARFSCMLVLPVLHTALVAGARAQPSVTLGSRTVGWSAFNRFVLALAVLHLLFVVPVTIGRLYSGG
jgi:hypothetical protein